MLQNRNILCIPSAAEGAIGHKQEEGGRAGQRPHSQVLHSLCCDNRRRLEACTERKCLVLSRTIQFASGSCLKSCSLQSMCDAGVSYVRESPRILPASDIC